MSNMIRRWLSVLTNFIEVKFWKSKNWLETEIRLYSSSWATKIICTVFVSNKFVHTSNENISKSFFFSHFSRSEFPNSKRCDWNNVQKNHLEIGLIFLLPFLFYPAQMLNSQACVCTVSYAYLNGPELLKYSQYFAALEHRIPRVVEMAASLIKNIVDSIELKVTLSNVFLSGFCLGGMHEIFSSIEIK